MKMTATVMLLALTANAVALDETKFTQLMLPKWMDLHNFCVGVIQTEPVQPTAVTRYAEYLSCMGKSYQISKEKLLKDNNLKEVK